jgi:hypothetical protein
MQWKLRYGLIITLLAGLISAFTVTAQPKAEGIFVLTDRTWVLSGDTIWFALVNGQGDGNQGNVVHVQLENHSGENVNKVMIVTKNGAGEGYMPVPDSLKTGRYTIRAFNKSLITHRAPETLVTLITVVNRFDEEVVSLPGRTDLRKIQPAVTGEIIPEISESAVKLRDKVQIRITIPDDIRKQVKNAVVSASLVHPGAESESQFALSRTHIVSTNGEEAVPAENDGFYLKGRVLPTPGESLSERNMVLMSIPDSIPYFDYCYTDKNGHFRFKIKKAYGTAEIFLKAISRDDQTLQVALLGDILKSEPLQEAELTLLPEKQQQFMKEMLEAGYFLRIFSPETRYRDPFFSMEQLYPEPFYGVPDRRVYPSEFIELQDFMEISRELLPGVRFRNRDDNYILNIINNQERVFFPSSPLRLVNGIPFFSDHLLARFKSSDIKYIDLIYRERVFGDISFKGVLSIMLNNTGSEWIREQKNLSVFHVPCLQASLKPACMRPNVRLDRNLPDFRTVFLFDRISPEETEAVYEINVSDLKGDILVRYQGITHDDQLIELTGKIQVR